MISFRPDAGRYSLVVMHGVEQAQNMLYAQKIVRPIKASVS